MSCKACCTVMLQFCVTLGSSFAALAFVGVFGLSAEDKSQWAAVWTTFSLVFATVKGFYKVGCKCECRAMTPEESLALKVYVLSLIDFLFDFGSAITVGGGADVDVWTFIIGSSLGAASEVVEMAEDIAEACEQAIESLNCCLNCALFVNTIQCIIGIIIAVNNPELTIALVMYVGATVELIVLYIALCWSYCKNKNKD